MFFFEPEVVILKFPTIHIKTQIYTEIFRQITSSWALFWAKLQIQIKPQISENQSLYFASIRAEWRLSKYPTIQIKTQSAKIEEILKPKMTPSFFSLHIINAICLTGLWILIISIFNLFEGIESWPSISKSLIWLGIVLDNAVCFIEFMVVWLKVQNPPVSFYLQSAVRYVIYFCQFITWYDLNLVNTSIEIIGISSSLWTLNRIFGAGMCCVNKKMSNKMDGLNNPVIYAVGPTGNKAMAGA